MQAHTQATPNPLTRILDAVSQHAILWQGYAETPGIEQFQTAERYPVWRQTHRQLTTSDAQYAQANTRFHIQMVAAWIFALTAFFTITNSSSLGLATGLSCASGIALAGIICRAEQTRRNYRIGRIWHRR